MANVYRDYDQAGLDAQYNNRARFPYYREHFANWSAWSTQARTRLRCALDVLVGESPCETIDIFPADSPLAPIYVFIHGGYWYSLDKSDYSYVACGMGAHGVTTVVNNFGLAPDHDMDTIVAHNRHALSWIWRNASSFGGDRERIYVCGHSAGGHLALMLLGTDWPELAPELPRNLVKGVCSIGGIHDLAPIRLSFLNQKLRLTPAQVSRHSPVHLHYPDSAPLSLVVARDESPEFHRQSQLMADRWRLLGYPVELLVPDDLDHFSVVNELGDPHCALVRHQLAQMQIAFSASQLSGR
jgi:arylformamidase